MSSSRSLGSWLRRIIGAVVVVGLLVLALVTYQLSPGLSRTPVAGPPPSAGPSTSAIPSTSPASTPSATSTSESSGSAEPTSTQDRSGTPEPAGTPGPGTTQPGISIVATLEADETFTVVERIRLSEPIDLLTLTPIALDQLGRDFSDAEATISDLEITSGGEPQIGPAEDVTSSIEVPLSDPSDTIVLRYRLDGTVVRTLPSTTGRGLGAVGPLTADVPDDLRVVVTITGAPVINLYCPTLELAEQACAAGDVPELRVKDSLPWRDAVVLAQLNLTAPR